MILSLRLERVQLWFLSCTRFFLCHTLSMMIYIPDDIPTPERKMKLEVLPVVYALYIFDGHIRKAAEWLGISQRTIRQRFYDYPELKAFSHIYLKEQRNIAMINEKMPLRKMMLAHLERAENSFWFYRLSEKEKEETRQRIKKLYK